MPQELNASATKYVVCAVQISHTSIIAYEVNINKAWGSLPLSG